MNSAPRLSDEQRLDWLQLIRSENIGPRTFRTLLNRFGGAAAALQALPELIRRNTSGRSIKMASRAEVEEEMTAAAALGVRFIALGEPDYPPPLRAIDAAPPLIAVRGQARALAEPAVAIVGSRNASAAGLAFTDRLARGLGRTGFVIVSGLARGIDLAAHRATLESGTIAVLAGGHGRPYPAEHAPLLDEIAEKGATVSEMPLNWEPRGRDFPRRNRIVSGLSLGTVVVEAARRSGSLITARFASDQGREVFAVPGSPLDPRSEGTNDLLREGATLCTRVEDVESVLAPLLGRRPDDLFTESEPPRGTQEKLWDELDLFDEGAEPSEA
ncbi:MAG: DNA-protecting protein DprA, partial [Methylobacteriaceae bacterium]|nr:DNA-protecting protein DprA [Methylobacteriaceae bacterium]